MVNRHPITITFIVTVTFAQSEYNYGHHARALIAESLKADPGLSNREHARRTGTSDNTVGSVRRELESTAQIAQSETRVSADGRVRPATQPKREPEPEPEPSPRATALPQADLDELKNEYLHGHHDRSWCACVGLRLGGLQYPCSQIDSKRLNAGRTYYSTLQPLTERPSAPA